MKKGLISMGFAALALGATAQVKIKDGTITGSSTTPNSNAILELESSQRGLLYPRVALSSTSSASPLSQHIKGMVVYDTVYAGGGATAVTPGVYYNDGTQWVRVVSSASTAFIYGVGTPAAAGASCSSTAQNTIYTDTGSASATLGQTWICDGTTWQNYSPPAATEWYVAGTGTDAGASKTADISHAGTVNIYHGNQPTTAAASGFGSGGINLINDNTGSDTYDDIIVTSYGSSGTSGALQFRSAHGTATTPANLINNEPLGGFIWRGYINGGWITQGQITATYTGDGTTSSASVRVIGVTDFSPTSSVTTLGSSAQPWGQIYSTSGTIQTSDIRLKKDIEPLTYGLNQIMQIEPISYNLKSGSNGATRLWGVSAQQMQNILPDVVNVGDDENKTLGVRYEELIPVLINAVKELKAENNAMQQQIEALKAGK